MDAPSYTRKEKQNHRKAGEHWINEAGPKRFQKTHEENIHLPDKTNEHFGRILPLSL